MGFWIFMLVMDLLVPATMIGYGKAWSKQPPDNINAISGYRTTMSMKNKETWNFAHKYSGRLWYKIGLISLPITLIAMLFMIGKDNDAVGTAGGIVCLVQIAAFISVIFPTEKALRKRFDKDGKRR